MPTILVVDDDPGIRELVGAVLDPRQFLVLLAADGDEALRAARESLPDVIVLDLMMPGIGGLDVCKELKIDPRTGDIPVLILTGRGEFEYRAMGEEARADAYLTKPFSPFTLLKMIEHLLELSGKHQPNHPS